MFKQMSVCTLKGRRDEQETQNVPQRAGLEKINTGLESLLVSPSSPAFFILGIVPNSCFQWAFDILNTLVIVLESSTLKVKQGLFAIFKQEP